MDASVQLRVNGEVRQVVAEPETSLLEVLRNDLELTGAKYGCGEGQCGACTVLLDGAPVRSCITPLSSCGQGEVVTIEGLEIDGKLHAVQQAFVAEGAMQCGYCIPGMIMNAVGVLTKNPNAPDSEILGRMEGNVCRCCGYDKIAAAIRRAAAEMRTKS